MHPRQRANGLTEWRDGWKLVLASMFGISFAAYGMTSMSIVLNAVEEEFGWSRGDIAGVAILQATAYVLLSPIVGYFVDRVGPRRIVLPGLALYAIAFSSIAFAGPSLWSWYALWAISSAIWITMSSVIWTSAVASRFDKSRGLALGLALAGHGIGIAMVPLVGVIGLEVAGWRGVFVALGVVGFVFSFPLAWLFFYDARDVQIRKGANEKVPAGLNTVPRGFTLRQALRQRRFWLLALAFLIGGGAVGPLQIHLLPILIDSGMSMAQAASIFAVLGPSMIFGRIVGGYLMDRFHPPYVAALIFAIPIVDCLLVPVIGNSVPLALIAAATLGLAIGAEIDTAAVLISRYFGMRFYGRIYAPITSLYTLGVAYSATVAGVVYDRLGSYTSMLHIIAVLLIIPVVIMLTLGKVPELPEVEDVQPEPATPLQPAPATHS